MKTGAEMILEERVRQMEEKCWTPAHDDTHKKFQLTLAAISYASAVACPDEWAADHGELPGSTSDWPWAKKWWKPSPDPVRNLVKAGALIAAEIDRLQRLKPQVSAVGDRITAGDCTLFRTLGGKWWIVNRIGEGTQVSDEKVALMLSKFFAKEF